MREQEQRFSSPWKRPLPAAVDREACPRPARHPANAAHCLVNQSRPGPSRCPGRAAGTPRVSAGPRGVRLQNLALGAAPSHQQEAMLKSINNVLPLNLTGGVE